MLQRAVIAGVIGRRYIEPGDTFEHAERMNWAVPVVEASASAAKTAVGKKRTAPAEPAEAPASADAGPDADLI